MKKIMFIIFMIISSCHALLFGMEISQENLQIMEPLFKQTNATPLHRAALFEQDTNKLIQLITPSTSSFSETGIYCSNPTNLLAKDNLGLTPLHYAMFNNKSTAVACFVKQMEEKKEKLPDFTYPFHDPLIQTSLTPDELAYALNKNAWINYFELFSKKFNKEKEEFYRKNQPDKFTTIDTFASSCGNVLPIAIAIGAQDMVKKLIKENIGHTSETLHNAKDATNTSKSTVLEWAIECQNIQAVQLLLEKFKDNYLFHYPQEGINNPHRILALALLKRNKDIVQLILDYGASPNFPDEYGIAPLHQALAVESLDTEDYKIIKLLLKRGANPDTTNSNHVTPLTPLHVAANTNNEELIKLLIDHGADPTIQCEGDKASDAPHANPTIKKLLLDAEKKWQEQIKKQQPLSVTIKSFIHKYLPMPTKVAFAFSIPMILGLAYWYWQKA